MDSLKRRFREVCSLSNSFKRLASKQLQDFGLWSRDFEPDLRDEDKNLLSKLSLTYQLEDFEPRQILVGMVTNSWLEYREFESWCH
ncbi:hypothetical protein TNCV_2279281 [Trichonephila clavipes]|uniref:Uncharacterized protein n=1 Tax=Trichonephila clavipes TaxID=2585209 RepID=A0A8X6R5G4_TRICX|nr:hypothetical protein TNCV_2279281 [Trichonephila clavipes]